MKKYHFLAALFMLIAVMTLHVFIYGAESDEWKCSNCGQMAQGNFCSNCGSERPWLISSASDTSEIPDYSAVDAANEEEIHQYEYYIEDCTWEEAFQRALDKGGYLFRINTREEFDLITSDLNNMSLTGYSFYIGGRRDPGSESYYWVDDNNNTYGDVLNSPVYWAASLWLDGEPSFMDGDIEESRMDIFFSTKKNAWVWNDIPNDVLSIVPEYSSKIGYIVEYDRTAENDNYVQIDPAKLPFEHIISEYRNGISIYGLKHDRDIVRDYCPDVNPTMIMYNNQYPDSTQLYYSYYDIDGNGTDELLLGTGKPDGSFISYFDVFTTDGTSTYRFFSEDSMGDRTHLTIYTDGTMDKNGSSGYADGGQECWIIGEDGFTPEKLLGFIYHIDEYRGKYYGDIEGNMFPEDYEESLLSKTEIIVTRWNRL